MKKNICLLVIVLLSVYQANAQAYDLNIAVAVAHDYNRDMGQLNISSWNKDFCDYYVHLDFINPEGFEGMSYGTWAIVGPGRQQIRMYRAKTGFTPRYLYTYVIYRGVIKKPNFDFTYALPTPANEAVTVSTVGTLGAPNLTFNLSSDTVYACRGGVMCDDNLSDHSRRAFRRADQSQITLYHSDGSFGEYVFDGKALVAPGKRVKMGDPIAVVDKYTVYFSVYFLDKNKLDDPKPPLWIKHSYLQPFFQTSGKGKVHLENDKTYQCEYTDELLMQEMSKYAKKKYLKNKAKKMDIVGSIKQYVLTLFKTAA
jgi:hypothetical protein